MATRGVSTVITYRAWDTSANAAKTGDVANHTLRWIKDGTSSAPANSPAEVDSTNAKGVYKLTLTSTETDCTFGVLAGVSSTANIAIFGVQIGFEYSASAAFPANFTSLVIDGSGRVDVSKIGGTAQTARDIGASVLLSPGTGTGQVSISSGVLAVNTTQFAGQGITAAGSVTIPGTIASSANVWTSALTEAYAALHGTPTAANILFEIRAMLSEKSVSGTTLTTKKIDGTTTAETFTLDSATAPTSITRAS